MKYRLIGSMVLILAVSGSGVVDVVAQDRPPDIVLFISDDHGWADSGAYGNAVVQTPHLDTLAREGLRFTQAFAATPTCTPSRSVLYTGLMPARNGSMANKTAVRDTLRALPHYFRELGYRVVLVGKHHVYPDDVFPFEHIPASRREPGYERGLYRDLVPEAVDTLLATHDPEIPLLLIVASYSPHVHWPENDGYDPETVDVPPYLIDTPATRLYRTLYYTDVSLMDARLGVVLDAVDRHGYRDRTVFVYTSDQGAQWPFAKWNLYDAGIRVPLLVRWPGEVTPGDTTDALVSLVDLLPTFLDVAGSTPPDGLDGQSFLPILLGKAQVHRPAILASHTGDFLIGPDSERINDAPMRAIRTQRHKYILNLKPGTRFATHIDVNRQIPRAGIDVFYWQSWLDRAATDPAAAQILFRYHYRPVEELYDLEADPFELNNVADDPAYRTVLDTLRHRLGSWRDQQGDRVALELP